MSDNSVSAHPELTAVPSTIEVEGNAYWTAYTGTRADLVAAGIATEEAFPVWPKRKRLHIGRDVPREQWFSIRYIKGGRYRVQFDRPMPPDPAPWNPTKYRDEMATWIGSAFDAAIRDARGSIEAEIYGRPTHQLAARDLQQLKALREQALHLIHRASVERAGGERRLRIVQ